MAIADNASGPWEDHWTTEADVRFDRQPLLVLTLEEITRIEQETLRNWSNSGTGGGSDWELSHLDRVAVRAAIITAYIVVITVGVVANSTILFLVARSKRLRTVTNIFIANLALSDLWLCVFCLPVQLHYQLTDYWVFGGALCRVVFSAFAVPMYVSTLSILLIAIDRYLLILYPLFHRMTAGIALALIAANVAVSAALSIPVMFYTSLQVVDLYSVRWFFCTEKWPSPLKRKVYTLATFALQFCLPITITSYLYCRIYARLRNRPVGLNMRTTRTNRILFWIVAVFVVCWLPWNIFSLLAELDVRLVQGRHFKIVDLSLKVFALGSACVNPLFYCWLNENFRAELNSVANRIKGRRAGESFVSTGGGGLEMHSCSRVERRTVLPYGSMRYSVKEVTMQRLTGLS